MRKTDGDSNLVSCTNNLISVGKSFHVSYVILMCCEKTTRMLHFSPIIHALLNVILMREFHFGWTSIHVSIAFLPKSLRSVYLISVSL